MMQHERNKHSTALVSSDDCWVDSVVSAARTVNKLFTRNTCRVCQLYSDKQVEFERTMAESDTIGISPVDRAFLKTMPFQPEVALYRQFLFDEDSVVDSVGQREGHDDRTISTHRTS